jgi:hypothetical protein
VKITVGGREQITTVSLLIQKNEEAWIEFTIGTWNVRIKVIFLDDKENTSTRYDLAGNEDHATLSLINWNNTLPMASTEYTVFGGTAGRKILFTVTGHSIGSFNKLDIFFYWENANGQ